MMLVGAPATSPAPAAVENPAWAAAEQSRPDTILSRWFTGDAGVGADWVTVRVKVPVARVMPAGADHWNWVVSTTRVPGAEVQVPRVQGPAQ
mmetsp:Transcript_29285/g.70264  ORF Transcript_29285/g.70264 Transcript_29285/m.70264 type:complete len:92 (+) Transcript_29285:831-1106(+)